MQSEVELERRIMNAIIKSKKLEGLPLIWIQTKLAMLVNGTPPEDIFLRQQAFGRDSLGFFSNILQGIPVTPGTTTSSFGGGPSGYQQALGAGIGGVGLYNALS